MKHGIIAKFLAFLLAVCSLSAAVGSGVGIVAMEYFDLYVHGLDDLQEREYEAIGESVAFDYVEYYAAKTLGNLPYRMLIEQHTDPETFRGDTEYWDVQLQEGDTILVEADTSVDYDRVLSYTEAPIYALVSTLSPTELAGLSDEVPETTAPAGAADADAESESTDTTYYIGGSSEDTLYAAAQSSDYPGITALQVPDGYLYCETLSVWSLGSWTDYYLYYYQAPEYTVTVYLQAEVLDTSSLHILTALYPYRYSFIAILGAGVLLFAICMVFLLWAAGKDAHGEIHPGGLNRLPLDVYLAGAGGGITALVVLLAYLLDWTGTEGPHWGNLTIVALDVAGIAVLGIGFVFAFAAQIKVKGAYWWKHSVISFCLRKLFQGIRWICRRISALIRMLPVIWQWLVTAAVMGLWSGLTFLLFVASGEFFFLLCFLVAVAGCILVVCYGGWAFGTLLVGARRMCQGDLNYQISTRHLYGCFRDFAQQLNSLSGTARIAAQKHVQSERMKTELITNVSHDIKTPLTSIINFVDLLQRPHSPQEEAEYLAVLDRQSQRLKRLIEDLMDLSKANTGNMPVNITRLDAAEAVNQALGEFADKLEAAQLTPVLRLPETPVYILADGRLVWRVMGNLLSNAVKYALPGTRLYVELVAVDSKVLLSLKNISRDALNISAEELLERFTRGDASRNTDGSGLGLNIAQSLMEVQRGELQLLLDGDLFKVTLVFPEAE
ncbi:MAG: HAMP domain-containing histidine kinase [Firmicutes bacterium]|nr:HAMP domain-containing histidine kinase [Bacillota bacterium]